MVSFLSTSKQLHINEDDEQQLLMQTKQSVKVICMPNINLSSRKTLPENTLYYFVSLKYT